MKHIALVAACSALLVLPAKVAAEHAGAASVCRSGAQVGSGSRPPDLAAHCLLKRFARSSSPVAGARYCAETWTASATWHTLTPGQRSTIRGYCRAHARDWIVLARTA